MWTRLLRPAADESDGHGVPDSVLTLTAIILLLRPLDVWWVAPFVLAAAVVPLAWRPLPGSAAAETNRARSANARPSDDLAWLAGCWELRTRSRVVEEQWLSPRGGVLLGVSRTTRGESAETHEFMRIYEAGDTLVYAAHPAGQAPTEFRSKWRSAGEIVFENLAHDFPQRVSYRRVSPSRLAARIEGKREAGGTIEGADFAYTRVACPGVR